MPKVIATAALKRKVVKLYGKGHTAVSIAKETGINSATVRAWAKAAGVVRSSLTIPEQDEETFQLPMELDESLPIVKIVKQQERREEERMVLGKTATPAEQFQTMVAANGIRMLDAAFKSAPVVKSMRDLATLTTIVSNALGISTKGGVGNKMSIDLNILTKGAKEVVTVDAEILEEKD